LVADGNGVCTQCHSPAGNPDFPTLRRADYDGPAHHFHPADSEAARCVSCHMPEQPYMVTDWRADHSFRVPRPDLGADTNSPDACTGCHTGETQAWAAAQVQTWYPASRHRGPHFGQTLALGRRDPVSAVGRLTDLAFDPQAADIVRATALFLMQPAVDAAVADRAAPLLSDPSDLVRAGAAALQRAARPDLRANRLQPLLSDPMRSVRIAAARELLPVDPRVLSRSQQSLLGGAMRDWQRSLGTRLDFPESHLVMGGMALTLRNVRAAVAAFREVVRLDPQRVEAWQMLVRISAATDGRGAARRILDEALRQVPGDPQLLSLVAEVQQ